MSRLDKVAFVSNLTGGSVMQLAQVGFVSLFSYWIWKVVQMRKAKSYFFLEFIILLMPLVLSLTLLSAWIEYVLYAQLAMIVLLHTSPLPIDRFESVGSQEAFVNAFRSYLQLLTCICILAVDFKAFPRYYAKTETYGVSLMDIGMGIILMSGVGGFVFSSGLVAGARLQESSKKPFLKTFKLTLPALNLGILRSFVTKLIGYQEHVSEYGVHWNFFITLGLLPILIHIQTIVVPKMSYLLLGFFIIGSYQYVLMQGLESYIFDAPRTNLFSMNREGIFSLLGNITT